MNGGSLFLVLLGVLFPIAMALLAHWSGDTTVIWGSSAFSIFISSYLVSSGVNNLWRREPEPTLSSTSDVTLAIEQLRQNYDVLRRQTNVGFAFAVLMMATGLGVLVLALVGNVLGVAPEVRIGSTAVSVILEFVGGGGLYLFNQNFMRLNSTTDELLSLWRLRTALEQAKELPSDSPSRDALISDLIRELGHINTTAPLPAARGGDGHD